MKGVGVDEFNRLCRKRLFKGEDYPFSPGDMVRVHFKVVEGNRERIQILRCSNSAQGQRIEGEFYCSPYFLRGGVERSFPLHSPKIEKIEVVRKGLVRRSNCITCAN